MGGLNLESNHNRVVLWSCIGGLLLLAGVVVAYFSNMPLAVTGRLVGSNDQPIKDDIYLLRFRLFRISDKPKLLSDQAFNVQTSKGQFEFKAKLSNSLIKQNSFAIVCLYSTDVTPGPVPGYSAVPGCKNDGLTASTRAVVCTPYFVKAYSLALYNSMTGRNKLQADKGSVCLDSKTATIGQALNLRQLKTKGGLTANNIENIRARLENEDL